MRNWQKYILVLAGVYNLAWGTCLLAFPSFFFTLIGVEAELLAFWQCLAVVVMASGLAYWLILGKIQKFWWLIALACLGKILGASVALFQIWEGELETAYIWQVLLNDFLWLPFFVIISHQGFKKRT